MRQHDDRENVYERKGDLNTLREAEKAQIACGKAIMAAAEALSFHLGQPIQRYWRDLNTVCSHAFWDWDITRELVGRKQFGLDSNHPLA